MRLPTSYLQHVDVAPTCTAYFTETKCNIVKVWPWNLKVRQTAATEENQLISYGNRTECSSPSLEKNKK